MSWLVWFCAGVVFAVLWMLVGVAFGVWVGRLFAERGEEPGLQGQERVGL